MNKEKLKSFFKKFNNSHIIAGICFALAFFLTLFLMIDIVAHPFITDMAYSAKISEEFLGTDIKISAKLVMLEEGRYKITIRDTATKETETDFGDYSYGKVYVTGYNSRKNVVSFDVNSLQVVQTNPFKITYNGVVFTNVGGIFLLVLYCFMLVIFAACSILLLVQNKKGNAVFGTKLSMAKRIAELEEMLGIKRD